MFGGRDPVEEPGTPHGTPGNWWTVFAVVPEILKHFADGIVLLYRSPTGLDPKLRELAVMRAGWARGSQFVFSPHCKLARDAGVSEAQIQAIPSWPTADCFDPGERAVLAYTDALVLSGGPVPDAIFIALKDALSDEQVLELTYAISLYEIQATMSRALRLEFDDVDDPVVEVGEQ
jgi:alkylhydroperoxidase family enzyme